MKFNDKRNVKRNEARAMMQKALQSNDTDGFAKAFDQMMESIQEDVKAEYTTEVENVRQEMDSRILTARGVHQLTSEESTYYQKVTEAMLSSDPKQALNNLDVVMPRTIIDSVFEDLKQNHPLLNHINFVPSAGAVELIMSVDGYQEAKWGALTDKIVQEISAGFKKVQTNLMKLSAFLPVSKSMLELGPRWLDRYVREVLYEALANGLEAGFVNGDGKDKPIGMTRDVSEGVAVVGGSYPKKKAVKISNFSAETVGNLLSLMAVSEKGKPRKIQDVILLCNPQDYLQKIMPATTVMAPDGTYRNDVMPYPMTIIQTPGLANNEALIGCGNRYFAAAGTTKEGKIEQSDEARFLEDERLYMIKTYANGMPKDDNSFILLDISNISPVLFRTETATDKISAVATLADLKIGALKLNETFNPETTTYTATTAAATNTIRAIPADANADVKIMVGNVEVKNGEAATWQPESNTVTITVTAEDGRTTKVYTVTVTRS